MNRLKKQLFLLKLYCSRPLVDKSMVSWKISVQFDVKFSVSLYLDEIQKASQWQSKINATSNLKILHALTILTQLLNFCSKLGLRLDTFNNSERQIISNFISIGNMACQFCKYMTTSTVILRLTNQQLHKRWKCYDKWTQ